jgi:hypothetical protein
VHKIPIKSYCKDLLRVKRNIWILSWIKTLMGNKFKLHFGWRFSSSFELKNDQFQNNKSWWFKSHNWIRLLRLNRHITSTFSFFLFLQLYQSLNWGCHT